MTLVLLNVTMHSLSHNFPIEIRMECSFWGILHVLHVLINCEVEFGIGEWMALWMNWGVSL